MYSKSAARIRRHTFAPIECSPAAVTEKESGHHRLKLNGVTGEVWNLITGKVIGILLNGGLLFTPYTSQYEPLANRHFDSFESFNSHFDEIKNESGG